jgi:hypothetical protein
MRSFDSRPEVEGVLGVLQATRNDLRRGKRLDSKDHVSFAPGQAAGRRFVAQRRCEGGRPRTPRGRPHGCAPNQSGDESRTMPSGCGFCLPSWRSSAGTPVRSAPHGTERRSRHDHRPNPDRRRHARDEVLLLEADLVFQRRTLLCAETACSAGNSSSEIKRMLANAVDNGIATHCVRMTMWLTPNSSQ